MIPPDFIDELLARTDIVEIIESRVQLKKTGAILFTIRIHLRQLKHVVKFEGIANQIAKALSSLPPEMQTYKQTDIFADSVQDYLNQF